MTAEQYRKTIARLGLSQVGAARLLGVNATTSRRWIANRSPIPQATALLLRAMIKFKLHPDDILDLRE